MTQEQRAYLEEFNAAASFIAAGVVDMAGVGWLAWLLYVKGGIDTWCAIKAWHHWRREQKASKVFE